MTVSSAIGRFAIGISPIGQRPYLDFRRTIISQYQNSPSLYQLISNFHDYMDPTANFEAFFDLIWNVDTAKGIGLDIWGRIVGVGRVLQVETPERYFGFEEATDADPFNQSPFYMGVPVTSNYALSDDAYRVLILAKALANISDGSIGGINQILLSLFPGRGNAYVTDPGDMTMVYTFEFVLTPVEKAVIVQSGVLPKPSGVSSSFAVI